IEQRDRPDAAFAFELPAVKLRYRVAQRRDGAHSGNDDSSSHKSSGRSRLPGGAFVAFDASLRSRPAGGTYLFPFAAYDRGTLPELGLTELQYVGLADRDRLAVDADRAGRVGDLIVQGARQQAVRQGEHANGQLGEIAAGAKIAEIALGSEHGHRALAAGEHALDGPRFPGIVGDRAGGVGIDVVDVAGADACLAEGGAHGVGESHAAAAAIEG